MKVRSERGTEVGAPKGAAIYGDLDDARVSRTLWIAEEDEEEPGMSVHSGDVQAVLDLGAPGMLVRYVVFQAAGDVAALAAAYADGFGALGSGMNEAHAILVDDAAQAIVSLTVWRDSGVLASFLNHEGFAAAQAKVMPYTSAAPVAENLRVL